MTKDRKARELGNMTLAALGVMLGSIVDTMKAADVPRGGVTSSSQLDQLLWPNGHVMLPRTPQ